MKTTKTVQYVAAITEGPTALRTVQYLAAVTALAMVWDSTLKVEDAYDVIMSDNRAFIPTAEYDYSLVRVCKAYNDGELTGDNHTVIVSV